MNLLDATLEIYREPHFTGYGQKRVPRAGEHAASQAFPDVVLDVAEVLKR